MKRLGLVLISIALVVGGFFTSCTKDEGVDALVSIKSSTDTTVSAGASFVISWDARKGDANMKKVSITKNDAVLADWNQKDIPSGSSDQYISQATLTADVNAGIYTYKVVIYDSNNNIIGSGSVKVTVKAAGEINSYTSRLLAAQGVTGTGSSLATTNGTVYLATDAASNSSLIDLIYYFNSGTEASSIYSPKALAAAGGMSSGWTKKNDTKFVKVTMTAAEFDAVANDIPILTKAVNLTEVKLFTLAVDNVFAFKTEAGKYGLVKVKNIVTGTSGSITIDVKVQK